jgi:hypothetical protein
LPNTNIFNVSQTFPDSGGVPTLTPVYTAKGGDNGIQGIVTAGPNSDPATTIFAAIQVDRSDGMGWVNVGGVSGGFGLTSATHHGPLDVPISIGATTYFSLQVSWKVRGSVLVSGTPVIVSFAGNIF